MGVAPFVVSVIALAAPHADADNTCGIPLTTYAITPHTPIDSDGGILIGYSQGLGEKLGEPADTTWTFADGATPQAAKLTRLAPGLFSILPSPLPGHLSITLSKQLDLVDQTKRVVVRGVRYDFVVYDEAPIAVAATPRSATYNETQTKHKWSRSVELELAAAPPDEVYAVIAFDPQGVAVSWVPATFVDANKLAIWSEGWCQPRPRGYGSLKRGDKISVAWVDRAGHVSPRSKEIVIR